MKKSTETNIEFQVAARIDTERIDRLDRIQREIEGRHDAAYRHHQEELARRVGLAQGELGKRAAGLELIVSEPPVQVRDGLSIETEDQEEAA